MRANVKSAFLVTTRVIPNIWATTRHTPRRRTVSYPVSPGHPGRMLVATGVIGPYSHEPQDSSAAAAQGAYPAVSPYQEDVCSRYHELAMSNRSSACSGAGSPASTTPPPRNGPSLMAVPGSRCSRAWLLGSDTMCEELIRDVPWGQRRRRMYQRVVDEPRLTWRAGEGEPVAPPGARNGGRGIWSRSTSCRS